MAQSHAEAYLDPGTPEEQSRRQFLANATIVLGGVIGLVLAVPLIDYSIPGKDINELSGEQWSPVSASDWQKLATSDAPLKVSFTRKTTDGYFLPQATDDYVWGVKMSDAQWQKMKADRTDLFGPDKAGHVSYENAIYIGGYVIFSSVCPHLGCRFAWDAPNNKFFCPCHNSAFTRDGYKIPGEGPAPRGLDPLPLREQSGKAEITWIRYKSSSPDRIIVSYA